MCAAGILKIRIFPPVFINKIALRIKTILFMKTGGKMRILRIPAAHMQKCSGKQLQNEIIQPSE
jgi:hypothetical protein